jgi:putative ABC transport system ATP-binding protein
MLKPLIDAIELEVIYNAGKLNEYKALRNESLSIYPGEYIILFGPSGCGKSTLLYTILGALPPTGGKLVVDNKDIYAFTSAQMVSYQRSVIGIIYQAFNLIASLSVLDNVSLPQIFANIDKPTRDARAMKLLERFAVAHVAEKLTTNLSGGQMQRVAVARSLVNDPAILLADEPVGNLDSASAEAVMNTLEQVNSIDRKTVILVTHDAKYLPYAHRVYYMKDGGVEREVANPEKKQIKHVEAGKTIVTEIEKLGRMYPYSSIEELRVKSVINYLTQNMDFDQLSRVEKGVEDMIKGAMSRDKFFELLIRSYREGGAGLSQRQAAHLSERIALILEQATDIRRYRTSVEHDEAFYYQHRYADRLKEYLLEEFDGKLSPTQEKALEMAVADRVSGLTRKEEFFQHLDKPLAKGGVGLRKRAADELTRHLEKLLAIGIEYIKGKH